MRFLPKDNDLKKIQIVLLSFALRGAHAFLNTVFSRGLIYGVLLSGINDHHWIECSGGTRTSAEKASEGPEWGPEGLVGGGKAFRGVMKEKEQSQKRYMVSGSPCPLISFPDVYLSVSFVVRGQRPRRER